MKTYFVVWEIEVDADSPRAAAKQAQRIQRDPHSIANYYMVREFDTDGDHEEINLDTPEE